MGRPEPGEDEVPRQVVLVDQPEDGADRRPAAIK